MGRKIEPEGTAPPRGEAGRFHDHIRSTILLFAIEQHAPGRPAVQVVGYAGVGLAYARWTLSEALDASTILEAVAALRGALLAKEGYAVIEDAPAALRTSLDLWGAPPATLPLMQALKA